MKSWKRLFICIFTIGGMILSGCDLSRQPMKDSEEENNCADNIYDEELEVVFLNYWPKMLLATVALQKNEFYSFYIPDDNPETLYAFIVRIDNYYDGKSDLPKDYPNSEATDYTLKSRNYDTAKAVELMKKAGLAVLKDYPYCFYNNDELLSFDSMDIDKLTLGLCVVVGTMDEIKRVFDETESMEGWYCYVWSAPRPDMVEKIKESGWTGTAGLLSSYSGPTEFYKSILGEENQVKMRIEIKE